MKIKLLHLFVVIGLIASLFGVAVPSITATTGYPEGTAPFDVTASAVVPSQYALTMAVNPAGGGTTAPVAGVHDYPAGTVVEIAATPSAGWRFNNWTSDIGTVADAKAASTTITMTGNCSISANFTPVTYDLTINIVGSGTTSPEAGVHRYPAGTVVNLTATPDKGWEFAGWSGDLTNPSATASITMDSNKKVTATFTQKTVVSGVPQKERLVGVGDSVGLFYISYSIISDDNSNGLAQFGETIGLKVMLENRGTEQASSISADLATTEPKITITGNHATWGDIAAINLGTCTDSFQFRIAGDLLSPPFQSKLVTFSIEVHWTNPDSTTGSRTQTFPFTIEPCKIQVTSPVPGSTILGTVTFKAQTSPALSGNNQVKFRYWTQATGEQDSGTDTSPVKDWTILSGKWAIENGELSSKGDGDIIAAGSTTDWQDYTVEFKGKWVGGPWVDAFTLRFLDTGSTYWQWNIGIGGWGHTLQYGEGAALFPPVTGSTIEADKWYRVKLVLSGKNIKGYLDDQLILDYTRGAGSDKGRIGLKAQYQHHFHFDDVKVTGSQGNTLLESDFAQADWSTSFDTRTVNDGEFKVKASANSQWGGYGEWSPWAYYTVGNHIAIQNVSATPDLITPNGNGQNDNATISFTLTKAGAVTAKVYNATGNLVRTLADGVSLDAGVRQVVWDGKDGNNQPLDDGTYTYKLNALDAENQEPAVEKTGTVALVQNPVVITDPQSGAEVEGTITVTASVPAGITNPDSVKFEYAVSGTGSWHDIGTDLSPEGNFWAVDWDTLTVTNGDYQVRALLSWANNLYHEYSTLLPLTVKNIFPSSEVTSPTQGAMTNADPLVIQGTASDNSGPEVIRVEVKIKNVGTGETLVDWQEATLNGDGVHWSYSFSAPVDGQYSVQSRATNEQGKVEVPAPAKTFTIDGVAPVTTDNADALWHKSTVTVTFTATDDGGGVAYTKYQVDSGNWQTGNQIAIGAPGDHSNDGIHTINYHSADQAGNVEQAKSRQVKIDTTKPVTTLEIGEPKHNEAPVHVKPTTTFTLSATDTGSEVKTISYKIDSQEKVYTEPFTFDTPGNYTLYYASVDNADNQEEIRSLTIRVEVLEDKQAPTLVSVSPANNVVTKEIPTAVTAVLSDGFGEGADLDQCNLVVKKNGEQVTGTKTTQGEDTLIFTPAVPFTEGEYSVVITPVDKIGNTGSAITTSFAIDTTFPVINISGVTDGTLYETPVTPVVEVVELHLQLLSLTLNGTAFTSGNVVSTDREHSLVARAVDRAGNETTRTISFTLDTPPAAPSDLAALLRPGDEVELSWKANVESDLAGYNIYRNGVKVTTGMAITYLDSEVVRGEKYSYQVKAVDQTGHESQPAAVTVPALYLQLVSYGTQVGGVSYLTRNFADLVKVSVQNEGTTAFNVQEVKFELLGVGDNTLSTSLHGAFGVAAGQSQAVEEPCYTAPSLPDPGRVKVTVNLGGGVRALATFELRVRVCPATPLEVTAPALTQGYADEIEIKVTNCGSAPLSIRPKAVALYLKSSQGTVLSQGSGGGSAVWVEAGNTLGFKGFLVIPAEVSGQLQLETTVPTYFGAGGGQQGQSFSLTTDVNVEAPSLPPLEVSSGTLIRGGTARITVKLNNQGTAALFVLPTEVMVYIENAAGKVLAWGSAQGWAGVVAQTDQSASFSVEVRLPADLPDQVTVRTKLSTHWATDNSINGPIIQSTKTEAVSQPPYNATATTDKGVYNRGEEILISGEVRNIQGGDLVPDSLVRLTVSSRGFVREFVGRADGQGQYRYTFKPLPSEAGTYVVGATHPWVVSMENDASFEILGLYLTPMQINLDMSRNSQGTVNIEARNLGVSALTGITLEVVDANQTDGVSATFAGAAFDLSSGQSRALGIEVSAAPATPDTVSLQVRATCAQGSVETATLNVKLHPAMPAGKLEPTYLDTGLKPGGVQVDTVTVFNIGYEAMNNVAIIPPTLPWISISGDLTLGNIPPGQSKSFDIFINPPQDTPPGVYTGEVKVTSSNLATAVFPLRVVLTAAETGDLVFVVKSDFGGTVAGAEIRIVHQDVYTLSFSGETDSTGRFTFQDIPIGRYNYRLSAPSYSRAIGDALVEVGTEKVVEAILNYEFLKIEWYVLPIKIRDEYVVVHKITYETKAPIPYIETYPQSIVLEGLGPGESATGQLEVKNMNELMSVFDVKPVIRIPLGMEDFVSIEFPISSIPEIKPLETVVVPYVITFKAERFTELVAEEIARDAEEGLLLSGSHGGTPALLAQSGCSSCQQASSGAETLANPAGTNLGLLQSSQQKRYLGSNGGGLGGILCNGIKIETSWKAAKVTDSCGNSHDVPARSSTLNIPPPTLCDCASALGGVVGASSAGDCCKFLGGGSLLDLAKCLGIGWASNCLSCATGGDFYDCVDCLSGGGTSGAGNAFKCGLFLGCQLAPYIPPLPTGGSSACIGCTPINWLDGGWAPISPPGIGFDCSPELCIRIKLEIEQELTLERQAFNARLTLTNTLPAEDLTDIKVDIEIRDPEGNLANDKFFINITGIENIAAIDGSGVLHPGTAADISWLFVPQPGAGGTQPWGIKYTAKAIISGKHQDHPLVWETLEDDITVKPMPVLVLDYFLPKKVYGDDAMTVGVKEPVIPFLWGVRTKNTGFGPAQNLAIESAQPKIVESSVPGVWIQFKLLGTWVNGAQRANTLNINFGDIPPGGTSTAGWEMMVSHMGNFVEYTAGFTHSDALGGTATSLLEEIRTHVLMKEFINDLPGQDNMFDFLVDTDDDGTPDMIFESSGTDHSVTPVAAQWISQPTPQSPTGRIALPENTTGWSYIALDDPMENKFELIEVARSDGKKLHQRNFWLREGKVYFVDQPAQEYLLTYQADVTPPTTTLASAPAIPDGQNGWYGTVPTISLSASEPGVTYYQWDGEEFLKWQVYTQPFSAPRGEHVLYYYSVDTASTPNKETTKSLAFKVSGAVPGDANGDGVVDAVDITKVERIIAALDALTEGADANQDGYVNALDLTKVERIIAELD